MIKPMESVLILRAVSPATCFSAKRLIWSKKRIKTHGLLVQIDMRSGGDVYARAAH